MTHLFTNEEIGQRIRQARKEAGLTLDQLAAAAYTSRSHLIQLEKGRHRPSEAMLTRIGEATRRPLEFFVGGEAEVANLLLETAQGLSQALLQFAALVATQQKSSRHEAAA